MSHCLSFVTLRITRRKFSKPPATLTKEELQTELKGHSQLWGRSDLETSFLTLKRVRLNLKSKIRFNLRSVLLGFQSFTENPVFHCAFAAPGILI